MNPHRLGSVLQMLGSCADTLLMKGGHANPKASPAAHPAKVLIAGTISLALADLESGP